MIPKKIHYIWFGKNPMPELAEKCIASWKKFCPDYQIIEWNEDNYDISKNEYMHQSYLAGKYGFSVDYARLDIIYQYGGIYLDTDVELVKPLDDLLANKVFMGFETQKTVALGLGFGAEAGNDLILEMMKVYHSMKFINPDGSLNLCPSPGIQTQVMKRYGLNSQGEDQVFQNGCHVYPKHVFNPYDMNNGRIKVTPETISIHHYLATWATKENHRNIKIYHWISRVLGNKAASKIKRVVRKAKKK